MIDRNTIIIYNENIPGKKEYSIDQYNRYINKDFNFQEIKRIKNDILFDYHKIFIGKYHPSNKGNTFHPVEPCYSAGNIYADHVKNTYKQFYIDHNNKTIVCIEYPDEVLEHLQP